MNPNSHHQAIVVHQPIIQRYGRWLALGLCACVPLHAHCQIYSSKPMPNASIVLSNFESDATPELLLPGPDRAVKSPVKSASPTRPRTARADGFREMVDSVARSVDVAPQLLHAVIAAESNYDPNAVSSRGAIGLMQLLPSTARRFGVNDPTVARDNIFAGARYLKWLMGYFSGDMELVLAAYNAGEQAVVRAGHKVPNYPETQAYVRRIMGDLRSQLAQPS